MSARANAPKKNPIGGGYVSYFEKGQTVMVIAENSQSPLTHALDNHSVPIDDFVDLVRFDSADNSWLVGYTDATGRYLETWIFQDLLVDADPVTEDDVQDAIASIKMGMNPDLIRMLAYEQDAIAQGYKDGDVNHYVQPVIGLLRMKLQRGELPDKEFLEYTVERLLKACKAETAWLKAREKER